MAIPILAGVGLVALVDKALPLAETFLGISNSEEEKKTVQKTVNIIKEHEGDAARLKENKEQMDVVLEGLSLLLNRLNQHYENEVNSHIPPSNAMAPSCCHDHHRPWGHPDCHHYDPWRPSGCHHHDPRGPSGRHHHDPRGPSGRHHHDPRGPSGHHHSDPRGPSRCHHHDIRGPSGCCHHEPRGPPGCHHHGPKGPSGRHHHDPMGPSGCYQYDHRAPSDRHHNGGPSRSGYYNDDSRKYSRCPCCAQDLRDGDDDEGRGAASREPSSRESSWRQCCVCYNNYNISNRRPTILGCGHTFCRECVGNVARRGVLLCPTCRTLERRPSSLLPLNVVLMHAMEEENQLLHQ